MMKFKKSILWLVALIASVALVASCYSITPTSNSAPPLQYEESTQPEHQIAPSPDPVLLPQNGEPPPSEEVHKDSNTGDYRLAVDGLVDTPLMLSYESIMQYPTVTDKVQLVCPYAFEETKEWTGVSVTTILAEAGIKPQAKRVMFYASDGYNVALSLKEAQRQGVFLAYKANGKTLTKEDGYPLRLVAEGMDGSLWVKWLERVEIK